MRMHNPPHPGGELLRRLIEPLGIFMTRTAKHLGVSRKALSELVHGYTGVSPEMAVRISIAFGTSAELRMNMPSGYDLRHAEQRRTELNVESLVGG